MKGREGVFRRVRLICPRCRQGNLETASERSVLCPVCDARYPREGRLVDLLPERNSPLSIPQRVMESSLVVPIYDSLLWRRNPLLQMFMGLAFDEEAEMMLRTLRLRPGATVLDLACGTGIYGRRIAKRFPGSFVIGLDLSLPMLGFASRRFDEQGSRDSLLIHGDAQDLPLDDGAVDAALCGGALHLFPDPAKAIGEAGRVVKPGGVFAAAAYFRRESWLSLFVEQIAGVMGGVRGHSRGEYLKMMRDAGFKRAALLHEGPVWMVLCGVREEKAPGEILF